MPNDFCSTTAVRKRAQSSSIALLTIGAMLCLAMMLGASGCSTAQSDDASQQQDQHAQQQEDPTEAFKQQIVGSWKLAQTEDGETVTGTETAEFIGVFWALTLNEDGTGTFVTYQNGEETSPNDVTWEIKDEASASMTINGVTSTLTMDDGILTAKQDDGSVSLTFEETTREDIDATIEEFEEYAATNTKVELGEKIKTDNYEFKLTKAEVQDEIYPPNTSGFYNYYQDEKGSKYYVITGTFKNLGSEFADIMFGTDAQIVINDEYTIAATVTGSEKGGSDFYSYQPNPLETVNVTIFTSISDEMADELKTAHLEWRFTDQLNTYYNDSLCTQTYIVDLQ
ncbi:hypothetical protein DMP06_08680 [Slackia equolifaciens]|uniref:Lipocalin-like domain-containing protein n=1 Tax=Slackia equolifaciens TaxID=498718 RepID=A0A3N0AW10_9ACTN|nr:hypothetical protein [Slackia equolifaciens]RNL38790.1 hypothetical protein DMP06_08680 [Slackia equolifaciens]